MPEVSDIDLMRLADGTLADPQRSAVEAEVSVRPDLQEQYEAYRATGKALAQLFGPIADAPVPERLLATIQNGAGGSSTLLHRAASMPPNAPTIASRARDWLAGLLQPEWSLSPMAGAAALTCVVAISAAIMLTEPPTFVGEAPRALADALEKIPSDEKKKTVIALEGADSASFLVDFSFQHRDGRYCRQYYLGLDGTRALVGFACSAGNGQWHVEMDGASPVRTASKVGDIRPSEGPPSAVDAAVEEVMVGDSLLVERENALIEQGWPRKK
jgi:hypothetical protein